MKLPAIRALLMALAPFCAQADCTLVQPANMNLGTYTGTLSTTGSIVLTVNCSASSADYTISMSAGTGASATTSNRKMTGPASSTLNYGLFRNSAHSQNWGNTAGNMPVGSGSVARSQFTVYPQIPSGQLVTPGSYVDTIATGSRSFSVTAVVAPMCQITATNMDFGSYTGEVLDAVSTVTLTCTKTTSYYVNLGDGLHRDGNSHPRAIGPGSVLLSYRLYRNAARNSRWGNTFDFDGVAGTGTGSSQTLTVYGRVFAGQFVTPGAYTDTVIATVTY